MFDLSDSFGPFVKIKPSRNSKCVSQSITNLNVESV